MAGNPLPIAGRFMAVASLNNGQGRKPYFLRIDLRLTKFGFQSETGYDVSVREAKLVVANRVTTRFPFTPGRCMKI
jgi:hypothetical protein